MTTMIKHISWYKKMLLVVLCIGVLNSNAADNNNQYNEYTKKIGLGILLPFIGGAMWYYWRQPSDKEVNVANARASEAEENRKLAEITLPLSFEQKKENQLKLIHDIVNAKNADKHLTLLLRKQDSEQIDQYKQRVHDCYEKLSPEHLQCKELEKNLNTKIGIARARDEMLHEKTSETIFFDEKNNAIIINL